MDAIMQSRLIDLGVLGIMAFLFIWRGVPYLSRKLDEVLAANRVALEKALASNETMREEYTNAIDRQQSKHLAIEQQQRIDAIGLLDRSRDAYQIQLDKSRDIFTATINSNAAGFLQALAAMQRDQDSKLSLMINSLGDTQRLIVETNALSKEVATVVRNQSQTMSEWIVRMEAWDGIDRRRPLRRSEFVKQNVQPPQPPAKGIHE